MKGIGKPTRRKLLGLGLLALAAQAADAQLAASDTSSGETLERIEVTGSSIRRTDRETPSEVQVITAEDLKKSGYTTTSEVLRNISANNQGTLSQAFSGAFAAGASGVALRGLTVGATLVLIDGNRAAPYPLSDDGERSFVDISQIPFDAIDHIEILKDGASAVYGSDAMAGVVNVILKKSFTGTRISAETGTSQHKDGAETHLSITHGFGVGADDGWGGVVSAEYRHQDQILLIDRPGELTLRDYSIWGGVNAANGVGNAVNGGYPLTLGGYTINPTTGATTQLGSCQSTVSVGGVPSPNCPWFNPYLQVQPNTQNVNLVSKLHGPLGGGWRLDVDASLFSSNAEQVGAYDTTNIEYGGIYGISAGPGVSVPTVYPASGPIYATLSNGDYLQTTFTGVGPYHTVTEAMTYRFVTTVSGDLAGWEVHATAGFNKGIVNSRNNGSIYVPGYEQILNEYSTGTAAQLNAALQSASNTSILAPVQYGHALSEVDYLKFGGSTDLFKLPNGNPVSLGAGVEYTYHRLDAEAPPQIASGEATGNDAFAIGVQNVASAYAELDSLVLKNLELNAAARFDHVDTFGHAVTPRFGFKFTPINELALRGTVSQGFRAPNPAEAETAGQAFLYQAVYDPLLCPGEDSYATDYKSQCTIVPTFYQESNPQLRPERSTSYTGGFILEPAKGYTAAVDYYRIDVRDMITSAANVESAQSLAGNAVRGPSGEYLAQENGQSTAARYGEILYIPVPYINAESLKTEGVDVDLTAKFDLRGYGRLTTDFNATHIFKYELTSPLYGTVELAGTHGPSGISGDTATPRDRFVWSFSWDRGPWDVTTNINYVSGYTVTDPSSGQFTCTEGIDSNLNGTFTSTSTPTSNLCRVASFTTFDLTSHYDVSKTIQVHAGILNLFNRQAPLDLQTYGGSNYNPSLHQAGAVGRYYNVGLTYDF